jgi:S-DNA-T family DNA segregation ATPase FtsK/SpoIIIE
LPKPASQPANGKSDAKAPAKGGAPARAGHSDQKPADGKHAAGKPTDSRPAGKPAGAKGSGGKPGAPRANRGNALPPPPILQGNWWTRIPPERRIDILGIILALIGFLSLLSLLSTEHGTLTRWWVTGLRQAGGVGSFILPAGLLLWGIWLILRKIDRLPTPSGERLAGIILIYFNILAWLHIVSGGGWALAAAGGGGGYGGAVIERLLVDGLGGAGAVILLSAWMILAVVMLFDISVTELFAFFRQIIESLLDRLDRERALAAERQAAATQELPVPPPLLEQAPATNGMVNKLPPDFIPLPGRGGEMPVQPSTRAVAGDAGVNGTNGAGRANSASGGQQVGGSGQPAAANARPNANSGTVKPPVPTPTQVTPPPPAWRLPVVAEILDPALPEAVKTSIDADRGKLIETTLASFGAPAHVVEVSHGPTVTQFGVEPDFVENRSGGRMRVRVSKIVTLADDLALALAASRIRIQAPVPGRSYVGIEVPNADVSRVLLREVLESESFQKIRSPMRFALGKDVSGKSIAYDLAGMPHLLIAGTTGSGKSVCVNSLLSSLLLHNSPTELRMILVDPKRVELTGYNGIPHLLSPVIVEADRVVGALQWVQREMDARYHRFAQVGARNIQDYNKKNSPAFPFMLVLIDELADLMMLAPDETERSLTRLAQLARATGIHLVLATQRPSVDVVTGLIKANFPSRIAFAVASGIDSRVILDQPGAERLLGRGDMLFQAPDAPAPVRVQGVWVSDGEIQRIIDFWRQQDYDLRTNKLHTTIQSVTAEPVNMDVPLNTPLNQGSLFDAELGAKQGDPILSEAIKFVRQEGKASISMLQRKFKIGYTRAARLIDSMEDQNIVGPAQVTSQVRAILDMGDEAPEQ